MIKFFSGLILVGISGWFLINQIPSWKQRAVEVINPVAKEARLLGELGANLDELDDSFNSPDGTDPKKSSDLVAKSKNLVEEIIAVNQKNSGIIKQGIGKIIDAFIDKTPYPADHLTISQKEALIPVICPTIDPVTAPKSKTP